MASSWITVHTDGCSVGNPGPAGYGAVLRFNQHRKDICGFLGHETSNRAELLAIIKSLEEITAKGKDRLISIYSDSQYCVGVCDGSYRIRANHDLIARVHELVSMHQEVRFNWIPREQNIEADKLSKKGAGNGPKTIREANKTYGDDNQPA